MLDVFALIRQVADRRMADASAPLLDHLREVEEIESWLCDEASRRAYCQELAFNTLCYLFNATVAQRYAGIVSDAEWQCAVQAMQKARAAGLIPDFVSGMPDEHGQLLFARTSTFIMNQYEYSGAVGVQQGDVFFDCGACFGETALWARMCGAGKVYSFEPSPSTFSFLQANAEHYDAARQWFFPQPLAVGDKEGRLAFREESEHPGSNAFDAAGAVEVPVVRLDEWCAREGVYPDFIKMDLEGAEELALRGAEKLFREHKPRFAICLYHRMEDMWILPRLLKTFVPEYRMWCKKSAPMTEFVLFGSL